MDKNIKSSLKLISKITCLSQTVRHRQSHIQVIYIINGSKWEIHRIINYWKGKKKEREEESNKVV